MAPGADVANPDIQPAMHMAEACRLIWRRQIMQVVLQEYGARIGDDPEYVHEMRVAIRRARTAQELFGHYFRRSAIEPAFADLRRLGRRLGAVRDLDVALENLGEFRAGLPEAEQADVCKLEEFVQARRAAARQALLEWLDGPQHAATLTAFIKFTRSPGKGVKRSVAKLAAPAPLQVRHVMPGVIMAPPCARLRTARRNGERSAGRADARPAHRVQVPALQPGVQPPPPGQGGEALVDQLKRMQDHSAHSTTPSSSEAACSPGKRTGWTRSSSARLQDLSDTPRAFGRVPRGVPNVRGARQPASAWRSAGAYQAWQPDKETERPHSNLPMPCGLSVLQSVRANHPARSLVGRPS